MTTGSWFPVPDRRGIVPRVSSFIAGQGGSITEASQHSDLASGRLFMGYVILADSIGMSAEALCDAFTPIADEFEMDGAMSDTRHRKRVVPMVSRESHCLVDLPDRCTADDRDGDIAAAVSHHGGMHTPNDPVRFGRDVEKSVLLRGLRWPLEDRVLVHGNKAVVFARWGKSFPGVSMP